jgi:hypothetical protein
MSYESGIIKREFFFCAPPLGLLLVTFWLSLSCTLLFSRVCLIDYFFAPR